MDRLEEGIVPLGENKYHHYISADRSNSSDIGFLTLTSTYNWPDGHPLLTADVRTVQYRQLDRAGSGTKQSSERPLRRCHDMSVDLTIRPSVVP